MFKYPEKVHLCGHEIDVNVTTEPFIIEKIREDGTVSKHLLKGYYVSHKLQMNIYNDVNKPSMGRETFFHECLEAVDCHNDLGLTHTQITVLGTALQQIWMDIPTSSGVNTQMQIAA